MGAVRTAKCERVRSLVSLGLDGELSQIEQAALRAHVGRCAACAEFALDLEALTTELRTAPLERPAVAHMPARRRSALRTLQVAAAVAAVVLAAGMGSLAGSLTSRDGTTPTRVATSPSFARALALTAHVLPGNLTRPIAI
jgi:predicted anti-sigma-YlaC factor YlaD